MRKKTIYWRGRYWEIVRVDDPDDADELIGEDDLATMKTGRARILYRGSMSPDSAISAILHEAGHEMFPEWKVEPGSKSTSELGVFERDMKAFLEACGIDLRPLLVGEGDDGAGDDRCADCDCAGAGFGAKKEGEED